MNRTDLQLEAVLAAVAAQQAAERERAAQLFLACASATACSPSAPQVFQQLWNVSGKEA